MKEMGNLSHDRCYGTDKSTQKSGYGELTRKIPPLEKGDALTHRKRSRGQCEVNGDF